MSVQAPVQFPGLMQEISQLVEEHRQMVDEPLVLAIYYKPDREPDDIFLFEVIENFGNGAVDSQREMFEVTYNSTSGFPLESGQHLHLLLTNPKEFAIALRENWNAIAELRRSIAANDFRVLYHDPQYSDVGAIFNA